MAYLLDTNIFIEAKGVSYGMDFCPAFWDWLVKQGKAGTVRSIEQVANEIQDEELSDWLPNLGEDFFMGPDITVLSAMEAVSNWVNAEKYTPGAKAEFLGAADYHLIAHALAGQHTVVTHEQIEHTHGRVKIPNVCIALGVKYMRTHVMLRREKARFVLGRKK